MKEPKNGYRWEVRLFFAWYDFWIGAYYDRKSQSVYICLLPMIVLHIYRYETVEHAVWRVGKELNFSELIEDGNE